MRISDWSSDVCSSYLQMVGWFKTMVKDNAYTLLSQLHEAHLSVDLDRASGLRCPVQLVGGANSPARYARRLDVLAKIFPHAGRITLPLASHGMNLANPKAFNQAVARFLESTRRGPDPPGYKLDNAP